MKAAPALWLVLSTAGAKLTKLTDDRCDPTRERDDQATQPHGRVAGHAGGGVHGRRAACECVCASRQDTFAREPLKLLV